MAPFAAADSSTPTTTGPPGFSIDSSVITAMGPCEWVATASETPPSSFTDIGAP